VAASGFESHTSSRISSLYLQLVFSPARTSVRKFGSQALISGFASATDR
jgi:hypothetical protein